MYIPIILYRNFINMKWKNKMVCTSTLIKFTMTDVNDVLWQRLYIFFHFPENYKEDYIE